jgi:hypothetical protein
MSISCDLFKFACVTRCSHDSTSPRLKFSCIFLCSQPRVYTPLSTILRSTRIKMHSTIAYSNPSATLLPPQTNRRHYGPLLSRIWRSRFCISPSTPTSAAARHSTSPSQHHCALSYTSHSLHASLHSPTTRGP